MRDALALLYFGSCALWDLRTRRVPNEWLIGWCLLWMVLVLPGEGAALSEEPRFLLRMAVTVLLLFPFFVFRMAGAGDIKAIAVLAGMTGLRETGCAVLYGLVPAALWSLFLLLRTGQAGKRARRFTEYMLELRTYVLHAAGSGRGPVCPPPSYRRESDREAEFCLIPFFFLGFLAVKAGFAFGLA